VHLDTIKVLHLPRDALYISLINHAATPPRST